MEGHTTGWTPNEPNITGSGGDTPENGGELPVSALRLSLLAGAEPASNPENMLYCPPEGSDLVRGTGVHTVSIEPTGGGSQVQEIGRWRKRKDAWEESTAAGTRVELGGESSRVMGMGIPNNSIATQKPRRNADQAHLSATLEGEVTRMEPQSFQKAIPDLSGPTPRQSWGGD